ncbi:MAG: hypothetical protein AAF420_14565, partial [Pseudomonadota bacterium]
PTAQSSILRGAARPLRGRPVVGEVDGSENALLKEKQRSLGSFHRAHDRTLAIRPHNLIL